VLRTVEFDDHLFVVTDEVEDIALEGRLAAEVIAKSDELFLVNVKIKNPTAHSVTFTVRHMLVPLAIADNLQLVECGLLTPTTLDPQQEKEFAMAYLLEATAGKTHRDIKLTYEFNIQ
jgi:cytochrome c oxidase assembly protein Cox11